MVVIIVVVDEGLKRRITFLQETVALRDNANRKSRSVRSEKRCWFMETLFQIPVVLR